MEGEIDGRRCVTETESKRTRLCVCGTQCAVEEKRGGNTNTGDKDGTNLLSIKGKLSNC